jgi:lipopolysaccharide transport system permease protein
LANPAQEGILFFVPNSGNSSATVRIYTPESSLRRPEVLFGEMIRDLRASRWLAWRLTVRDISAQYRQTFLGILWALIMPLATTVTWIFLSASGVVRVADTALPYPVYVFTGTMLWAIFVDALNAPLQKTAEARSMLSKINFPREALVLSGILQTLFNGAIRVSLMLGAVFAMGLRPGWNLALLPCAIFSLILAGSAVGLLLTPIGSLYTDVGRGTSLIMQFLMYLTPVVFPLPKEGWVKFLFEWNPLTPLILTARDWLTGFAPEFLGYYLIVNGFLLALLFLVWIAYRAAMPILVERMSS